MEKKFEKERDGIKSKDRSQIIKENYAFIIKTLSDLTGRYIHIENDDLFSVGLMAFDEAMNKYDEERGPFYAFAQLVIRSRAKTYLKKMKRVRDEISVEAMEEEGHEFEGRENIDENMRADIIAWREDLALFGLEFEALIDAAPKHRDTRERAIRISKASSQEKSITDYMFKKFRLPISKVARLCQVSEKIVRTSKVFITAVIIIFYKKYESLLAWLGGLKW